MTLRSLFWKLFLGFWLTLIAAGISVGTAVWLYQQQREPGPEPALSAGPRAEILVRAAAATLRHGGEPALRALLEAEAGDAGDGARVHAVDDQGRELLGRAVPADALERARARALAESGGKGPAASRGSSRAEGRGPADRAARGVRLVETAQGRRLLLFVPLTDAAAARRADSPRGGSPGRRTQAPHPVLGIAIGLLASLVSSALLAAYLTRPIRHLRRAFADAADGRLDARVAPLMGRRRDEIAGLGEDFDRMAERLQKLIVSQRRLLHDVSHELRSPLARLQAAVGLARQDPARTAAMLDRIERDTQRLDALVGELLTLARLEANAGDSARQEVALGELLQEVVEDARFEAQARGREVRLDAPDGPVPIARANPEWLQRALENVIRNAVRHTADGSAVEVSLRAGSPGGGRGTPPPIVIVVSDRGPGVPPEQLEAIFEPFHRGGGATDGHGLGLAIARRALAAHRGTITAANRAGGGLQVTMTLPATG
jgi:two-component system OmpR family sensor kinase